MDIYKCPFFRKSKENPNRVFFHFYDINEYLVVFSITLLFVVSHKAARFLFTYIYYSSSSSCSISGVNSDKRDKLIQSNIIPVDGTSALTISK